VRRRSSLSCSREMRPRSGGKDRRQTWSRTRKEVHMEPNRSYPLTFTVTEMATLLGISRASAYQLVRTGELPALRLGRRLVVPRVALERLLGVDPGPQGSAA